MPLTDATWAQVKSQFAGAYSALPAAAFIQGMTFPDGEQVHRKLVPFLEYITLHEEAQDWAAAGTRRVHSVRLTGDEDLGTLNITIYLQPVNMLAIQQAATLANTNGVLGLATLDLSAVTDALIAGTGFQTNFTVPAGQVIYDLFKVMNTFDSDSSADTYSQKIRIQTAESSDGTRASLRIDFPVTSRLLYAVGDVADYS